MKNFQCDCVSPIWNTEKLIEIIDNAKSISKKKFLASCLVDDVILQNIKQFPFDFEYYQNNNIFFFKHSAIEHFYF